MLVDILLSLPFALVLAWLLIRSSLVRESPISPLEATVFLCLKWAAGIFLAWLYTYYYTDRSTADIYRFFDDGTILQELAFDNPVDFLRIISGAGIENDYFRENYFEKMNTWIKPFEGEYFNDNHTMVRLNALLAFISFGNYHVHSIVVTFLSFLGLLFLYKAFAPLTGKSNELLLKTVIFLTPSVLVWTSGVLKESLLMFALGSNIYSFLKLREKLTISNVALFGLSLAILCLVKLYFLAALVPAYLGFLVASRFPARKAIAFICSWITLFAISIVAALVLDLDFLEILSRKQQDFLNHGMLENAGSMVPITRIEGMPGNLPRAFMDSLTNLFLRPFPWKIESWVLAPVFLENVTVLFLLGLTLYSTKLKSGIAPFPVFLLSICLPVMLLIGLTTPIIGAYVRYKAPALVLLLIAMSLVIKFSKIKLLFSQHGK